MSSPARTSGRWCVRRSCRPAASDRADEEKRSLRFNDTLRTIVAQLPPVSYAAVRSVLEARVKKMGSDGETPLTSAWPTPWSRR